MNWKWLVGVIGATLTASLVVSVAFVLLGQRDVGNTLHGRIETIKDDVAAAHRLWEEDQRFDAVKSYKGILRKEERIHLRGDLPILYRRIIEHEAEYGDPSVARDWCLRAYEEWPGKPMRLTFSSSKATEIWNEVTAATEERNSSW